MDFSKPSSEKKVGSHHQTFHPDIGNFIKGDEHGHAIQSKLPSSTMVFLSLFIVCILLMVGMSYFFSERVNHIKSKVNELHEGIHNTEKQTNIIFDILESRTRELRHTQNVASRTLYSMDQLTDSFKSMFGQSSDIEENYEHEQTPQNIEDIYVTRKSNHQEEAEGGGPPTKSRESSTSE